MLSLPTTPTEVLNPATRIETQFGTDRATWQLLSLQTRLKQAKTPETRAAIVQAIQDTVRTMALLYSEVHTEAYRSGVQFGRENAQFYANAERLQQRSPHLKVEVRKVDRVPCLVVNGRSIS